MIRAVPLALSALALGGCITLQGTTRDLGVVEDDSLRAFLRPLPVVEDAGCTLTVTGRPLAMRCRVFRGPADERIVGVYDLVTDAIRVLMLLREDGRQEVLWLEVRRVRSAPSPEVRL